jgi:hypothetical protein
MPIFIDDGFTASDTFPASAWMASFQFTYRPALPERFYTFQAEPQETGKSKFAANAKFIIEHLVSWDLVDKDGNPLPTPKVINDLRRMPVQAISHIVNCICGYGASKEDSVKNSD